MGLGNALRQRDAADWILIPSHTPEIVSRARPAMSLTAGEAGMRAMDLSDQQSGRMHVRGFKRRQTIFRRRVEMR